MVTTYNQDGNDLCSSSTWGVRYGKVKTAFRK